MKDIVIGSITNYDFNTIRPYVNSLDQSGFDGLKVMICYNIGFNTVEELVKRGYSILTFKKDEQKKQFTYDRDFNICVERFLHMWYFLKKFEGKYRYIISTDVKDVVFQKNPSEYLQFNFAKETRKDIFNTKSINVSSESVKYCNEPWGFHNMFKSFGGALCEHTKDNIIVNAGVLSGKFNVMIDLFLNIYMLCNGASGHHIEGGGGPDQAALNVILNMKPWKDITIFNNSEDSWAAQLGTTGPQLSKDQHNKLVEAVPIMVDGVVCTSEGNPFTIVHQYDRVSEWKNIIEERFK
ncbi:hypothetical protein M0R04_05175 [Candidatus Dojkabacteria bacterium]|jgi:hypothetical protein|nr:hypothetical protein [Candidatus Dojkabacteria bacterium]